MKKSLPILLWLFVLCIAPVTFGQETTGSIEGVVKDPTGALVPNLTLTITNARGATSGTTTTGLGSGFKRTVTTNEEGFFRVLKVPPGTYDVVTSAASGFGEARYENVTVTIGQSNALAITVNPGNTVTTVDIVASDVQPVDVTNNSIQTTINAQKIELLPKGTGFTSLLKTVPGTRPESRSGGFSVDGSSGGENVFVLDGQEVTNYRTGTLNEAYNIPTQLVQEVQVKSTGFDALYGGATGGVVSVVTRGGGNEYHGEFGIQFEPAKFRGTPRPLLTRFTSGAVATNNFVQTSEYFSPIKTAEPTLFPLRILEEGSLGTGCGFSVAIRRSCSGQRSVLLTLQIFRQHKELHLNRGISKTSRNTSTRSDALMRIRFSNVEAYWYVSLESRY